jgi:hypothetical protein
MCVFGNPGSDAWPASSESADHATASSRRDLAADQFGCQQWQSIELILRPAVEDYYVLALD